MKQHRYAVHEAEKKWQAFWNDNKALGNQRRRCWKTVCVLGNFPYPSGTLHMGHVRNYTLGDVIARYLWQKKYALLNPMGVGCKLSSSRKRRIEDGCFAFSVGLWLCCHHEKSVQEFGIYMDWDREIFSCDPSYYKHEQAIFLDFYQRGIAYRKSNYVNWDPVEGSVLAKEQVIDGKGWHSGALLKKNYLSSGFSRLPILQMIFWTD